MAEFLQPDSWEALVAGCRLWIDAHLDPRVRQIVLTDARGVLGWDAARAIETRFSAVALRGALRKAMHAGVIERRPLRPLALMLTGALGEACLYVAESDDPDVGPGRGRCAGRRPARGDPGRDPGPPRLSSARARSASWSRPMPPEVEREAVEVLQVEGRALAGPGRLPALRATPARPTL